MHVRRILLAVATLTACSSTSGVSEVRDASATFDARADSALLRDGARPRDAATDTGSPRDGMDASAMDAGGVMDAAVPPLLCLDCLSNLCMASGRSCDNDPTCATWAACAEPCVEDAAAPACFQSCDALYADAGALFGAVYACMCSSCASSCTHVAPCAHGDDGGP